MSKVVDHPLQPSPGVAFEVFVAWFASFVAGTRRDFALIVGEFGSSEAKLHVFHRLRHFVAQAFGMVPAADMWPIDFED